MLKDFESLHSAQVLYHGEKDNYFNILTKNKHQIKDFLEILSLQHLPILNNEDFKKAKCNYGYYFAILASHSLGDLYSSLDSMNKKLKKDDGEKESYSSLDSKAEETRKARAILDKILLAIKDLLLCKDFLHLTKIENKLFFLKQRASTLPDPQKMPSLYKNLTGNNKNGYKNYTNFLYYFAGNWLLAENSLKNIQKLLEDLHSLCPLIRFSLLDSLNLNLLQSDLEEYLLSFNLEEMLSSHKSYIKDIIGQGINMQKASLRALLDKIKKIAEILADPLKDLVQFNLVLDSTIKAMLIMRLLQKSLPEPHHNLLNTLEEFFHKLPNTMKAKEILAMSYKIANNLDLKLEAKEKIVREIPKPEAVKMTFNGF
jgi:hypothetical protein